MGDTSVIHQTLRERHNLLCKYVKPMKGRLEILVPNSSLSTILPSGMLYISLNCSIYSGQLIYFSLFLQVSSIEYLIHIWNKAGACYRRTSDVFLECIVFLFFILCALTVLTVLGTSTSVSLFCLTGEPRWSLIARSAEDIEKFFKETIENRLVILWFCLLTPLFVLGFFKQHMWMFSE